MTFETARRRSAIVRAIREFFDELDYLEVDTPVLAPALIPESNIASFASRFASPFHGERELYLVPSPELWMKRLIAQGSGSLFQISKAFRNAEQIGRFHNPEFTMLEWYGVGCDCRDQIAVTERLFERVIAELGAAGGLRGRVRAGGAAGGTQNRDARADKAGGGYRAVAPPFRIMSMEEACRTFAGIELGRCGSYDELLAEARRAGVAPAGSAPAGGAASGSTPVDATRAGSARIGRAGGDAAGDVARQDAPEPAETWESLFNRIFLTHVEPNLPADRPLVLTEFPANIPSLAKRIPGTPWCERWELYLDGCEIANCYTEETDPERVASFFNEEERRLRETGAGVRVDRAFMRLFGPDYPRCSGVALGVDRLVMRLLGEPELRGVIFFPLSDILELHSQHYR